jgi:hypothetical protein
VGKTVDDVGGVLGLLEGSPSVITRPSHRQPAQRLVRISKIVILQLVVFTIVVVENIIRETWIGLKEQKVMAFSTVVDKTFVGLFSISKPKRVFNRLFFHSGKAGGHGSVEEDA